MFRRDTVLVFSIIHGESVLMRRRRRGLEISATRHHFLFTEIYGAKYILPPCGNGCMQHLLQSPG